VIATLSALHPLAPALMVAPLGIETAIAASATALMMALVAAMTMVMPAVASAATAPPLAEPALASVRAEGALLTRTTLLGGALIRGGIVSGGTPLARFGRGGRWLRLRGSLLGLLRPGRRFLRR